MSNLQFSALQNRFVAIRNNKIFEIVVVSIIILSALVIGAKTYSLPENIQFLFTLFDHAITLFFLLEIIIRLLAEERLRDFFKQGWNIFDFFIVVFSLMPVNDSELVLVARLLRIFRVLRLVSIVPELRLLVNALFKAIPRMGYVVLLMFVIFYIYAAVGSFMFEGINPELWRNVSISMLTLFRIATFEDWTDIMYETMVTFPLSWIFYLTFIFLTAFVFLNMMIGIILDVLNEEHKIEELDQPDSQSNEIHWIKQHNEVMEARLERIEALLIAQNKDLSR
jgi:voltage-gated sodium channel